MITSKQYVECLDMDENQMYVVRVYDSELNFLKQFELEKNNAPSNRAFYTYHETVWLKDEVSVFIYYNDIPENNARPILVLKTLQVTVNSRTKQVISISLNNLNSYLTKDTVFVPFSNYRFSDTENSLAIFNDYYFGLSSFTEDKKVLVIALFNIFNDDKTVHTHYFQIPFKDDYNIEYQSGLKASGYKNGYGIQLNYKQNNENRSGFIIFGYGNTTDPEPIYNLFDKYISYTIKLRDYYKGIENNLFCYVLVNLEITEIPSTTYISVTNSKGNILRKYSKLTLDDKITIKKKATNIPEGRYVLGITPYIIEGEYDDFYQCAADTDMFGEQIATEWIPDEYYGRTMEFKFTVGNDCFDNCDDCITKGLSIDGQKCTKCKYGFYYVENTNNCFSEPPDGYYFNSDKKIYSKCYDKCKT